MKLPTPMRASGAFSTLRLFVHRSGCSFMTIIKKGCFRYQPRCPNDLSKIVAMIVTGGLDTEVDDMVVSWRKSVTRFFLWVSVLMWGPLLGAKVFDLIVLAGAWSGSPPSSLRLLPYGSDYPVDTGEFFIPSSAILLFATFGALVSGWRTPLNFRALLAASAIAIFATLVLTVVVFWPLNFELWNYATGSPKATESVAEIVGRTRFWITMDWLRVAAAATGFIAAIRAISVPYPENLAPKDPLPVRVLLVVALVAVAAFLVYFVLNL